MAEILGVRIDPVSMQEAQKRVTIFLDGRGFNSIFTPNPEMLVSAHKHKDFRSVLNTGTLNVCDGKGIELFAKEKLQRIPGVDLMLEICRIAEKKEKSVYFLGSGSPDTLTALEKNITVMFPKLTICGSHIGPLINEGTATPLDSDENDAIMDEIIMKAPDVLFVAFGHRKQEMWIDKNCSDLPSVRIAMGVGGAFDYIAKKVRRAPAFMQRAGLEWLYRLLSQPSRLRRIATALIVFPYLVLKSRI